MATSWVQDQPELHNETLSQQTKQGFKAHENEELMEILHSMVSVILWEIQSVQLECHWWDDKSDLEAAEEFLNQFDKIRQASMAKNKSAVYVKLDFFGKKMPERS